MSMPAPIAPGTRVDGFTVGERVHAGAMGCLYDVTAGGAAFPMLMKVPRLDTGVDAAQSLLAFDTEALILPRLHGPHVPRFVAAGEHESVPYLVMERVPGESLDRRALPLAPDAVAEAGAAIADALHELHSQDAIHLDLKPDNVVLRPDGSAVLVDFALAHHRELPDLLAEERRHAAGSAPYVSPEQVLGSRSDARSDLFALGALLYELATGRAPFGAPRTLAGLRDRLWMDPAPPAAWVPALAPALQEVILRCLEPDPARRYQSAAHVAFDLRHPAEVPLTERAHRKTASGVLAQARRWWNARGHRLATQAEREAAPVVMVAVDTRHPDDPRQPDLQRATRRILSLSREFRLICVAVVPAELAGSPGQDPQVEHRIRLRHWIAPLAVDPARVSLHVLEAPDAAAALVDFAGRNNVDLIVLGAPAPGERARAGWRSGASTVTASAACSVHVVRRAGRLPGADREE